MQDNDSYARATVYFDNGSIAYFNPVIRTDDGLKPVMPQVTVSYPLSIIKWILTTSFVVAILYVIYRRRSKK